MKRRVQLVVAACCAFIAIAVLALSGCTAQTLTGAALVANGLPQNADSQPTEQLAGAINNFGFELLSETTAAEPADNVILSPFSVHAALSMTANGATDETEQQMRAVLNTDDIAPAEANKQWASLLRQLDDRSSDQTLEVANALWAREGIEFKKPFIDADRDYFGAGVYTLDFAKDDVPAAINNWASKNTHGMIKKMVERVPPNAILYLANAVYFKGDWDSPFEHEATHKVQFTRADRSTTDVDMMQEAGQLPYAENNKLQATRLRYEGNDTAFYVLLPKEGVSVSSALASLEGPGFSALRRDMSQGATAVVLGLPKLDAEFSTKLVKPLADMGMPRAFDDEEAQFSGMADLPFPIYISDVIHKTKVKVDEEGTEAAAVKVVEMSFGSAMASTEPARIWCDRPYLFSIVDEESGAMLFLGAVNDPNL